MHWAHGATDRAGHRSLAGLRETFWKKFRASSRRRIPGMFSRLQPLSCARRAWVATASFKTVRGYTICAGLLDELAFWPTDDASSNPDDEIITAIRPGMATIPNAMLLCASSPYSRKGALWDAHRKHFAQDNDPTLVWQAPTLTMNPTVPQSVIDEAMERDPVSGAAEFGAQFRRDIEAFVLREAVAACVSSGVFERAPQRNISYVGFADPSGGSADSMTLAIGHKDYDRKTVVVDALREVRPPFSPETVADEFARLLKSYRIMKITGDRYAGEWPRERFRCQGVEYELAGLSRSDAYLTLLPAVNTPGRIELIDNRRLISQLCGLERRAARSGRDTVDHPRGAQDDIINAAALALVCAALAPKSYAENWIEYYRRLAGAERSALHLVPSPEFDCQITPVATSAKERVRVPEGISSLYLIDGASLLVPEKRIVEVSKEDAIAFGLRGWERLGA